MRALHIYISLNIYKILYIFIIQTVYFPAVFVFSFVLFGGGGRRCRINGSPGVRAIGEQPPKAGARNAWAEETICKCTDEPCTIDSKINDTPKRCEILQHSVMNFDRSNKFDLCYNGQVNSLRLKSSLASKWSSKHLN